VAVDPPIIVSGHLLLLRATWPPESLSGEEPRPVGQACLGYLCRI